MSVSSDYFFYADVNYLDTSNVLSNYMNLTHNTNNSLDLSENILSKYARGIFFSPNYNKQFFDAINWANNLGDYKTQLNLINPYNDNVLENLQVDSTIIFTGGIFENGFNKNYNSNVDDIFNPFDLNEPGTISPPIYNYNDNFNNANIFSVSNISLNEWNGWQPDKDWAISCIVKAPTANTSCHLMHFGDPNNNNKYATVFWDYDNANNPTTIKWGVSWTSDSNTGRIDANHLGVVAYPNYLPSNMTYFQILITYDKRDYTPNGDPNKHGPRVRYKENGRDSDYGLAIFWRGSNDITMFNSEHSDLPWDLSGFPNENIQSGHTWHNPPKENETFNWTQTMTATIGGGPTGIVTHPDHGRHSSRGNIDETGYITDIKFWNTNIDPINQSQYIYSPPPNAIITANDNPTSGPNAGTQVPISLNTDNIEFRNAIAGNTIIPINNVLNIESPFNKYFGVIPTADSHNGQFCLYSFSLIQGGVTVFELKPSQETGATWDTLTPDTGFHQGSWGFQTKTSPYINNNTLWFYVEVPSNYQFTNAQLSINLTTYDGDHIPASGKFVTASQPTGPWIEIGNWSLSLPLPSVTPPHQGGPGISVSSIIDNGWQQLGSDIISWKTPGTYYMRYKATDYDGVETPNNDEHYLTVTVDVTLPATGFVEVNGATWSQGRLQGFGYSIGSFGQGDTVQGVQFKTELATDSMIGLTYNVPISDPVGGWAQGGYMIYPHLGNSVYVYDGSTSKGIHSTLNNNTQIWQIRVNINSRVELVKNGTVFFTFDSPSATAWSGGTQLYVVITWRPSNTYDWQWINASGEPLGDVWI